MKGSHSVRSTLLALGSGVVLQRALQLVAFLVVGRTLGVAGLGTYAQGLSAAAVLTVLASLGVRSLVARAVSQEPGAARAHVGNAVHLRLVIGSMLAIAATAIAFVSSEQPWFWMLCALHVLPAAFDLKGLIEVTGKARLEVGLESVAAVLQLGLVCLWSAVGSQQLELLAAASLGCRTLYAAGAIATIRSLPLEHAPSQQPLGITRVGLGQTTYELMAIGDIALVALCFGDAAAGYYAAAMRFAVAAMLPSMQLTRLLLAHLLHAEQRGNAKATFETGLRATLWLTLPIAAGGMTVADELCALTGVSFAAAGGALQLLLAAGLCQHVGWQCSLALLASGRDRAYAHTFAWPSLLQAAAFLGLGALLANGLLQNGTSSPPHPAALAISAATIAACAQGGYAVVVLRIGAAAKTLFRALPGPALAAAATAALASLPLPADNVHGHLVLPLRLALGALGFAAVLWRLELRGRLGKVGDGLFAASGFAK
ncbi:MAG: hypothetical protein AB8H80_19265 [Planctomycetota bacterium]